MIEAFIYDLDGTLVKTEQMKALSYAHAAVELNPDLSEQTVVEGFKQVVGRSRREVAQYLLQQFDLEQPASDRMDHFHVTSPWQAYVQVRLEHYQRMLKDPETIRSNRWPHTNELLQSTRERNCTLALATMSRCEQARQILEILGMVDTFDFIATRDDVEKGKPDPEIYHLVASELQVHPPACIVIEDSISGVEAALAAGMNVVAVATPFTKAHLHDSDLLPPSHIADSPGALMPTVDHVVGHVAD